MMDQNFLLLFFYLSIHPVVAVPTRTDISTHAQLQKEADLEISNKGSTDAQLCHYENSPMQYLAIFHGCKNDNF